MGEDVKVVANTTRRCLIILEESQSKIRRRIVADANTLQKVSYTMCAFQSVLGDVLKHSIETNSKTFKAFVNFITAAKAKDEESDQKTMIERKVSFLCTKHLVFRAIIFVFKELRH